MNPPADNNKYHQLIQSIGNTLKGARYRAMTAVNKELLGANWQIGKHIVEYEQQGSEKAEYGSALLSSLSKDLKSSFGRGFSKSNVYLMRQLYLKFPNFQTLSGNLSWSHYAELLGVSDDTARSFYINQSDRENWSVRELKRQIKSSLFERLALSKDKNGVLTLAKKGAIVSQPKDIVKDPYVLEFLEIPTEHRMTETRLEQKIIDNLQVFLLELGKGFSFVGRQYRITMDNDLKTRHVKHFDIGQMNLYLNFFLNEENTESDNPPIGIVLVADKNDILVEYATGGISNNIFVSKYQLYLPEKEELEDKVKQLLNE